VKEKARKVFIKSRDKHTCQYCLKKDVPLTLDHVVPKSQGGNNRRDNLITSCYGCNYGRQNQNFIEWCMHIASKTGQSGTEIIDRIQTQISKDYTGVRSKDQWAMIGGKP